MIWRADEDFLSWTALCALLSELKTAVDLHDLPTIQKLLQKAVTGYSCSAEVMDVSRPVPARAEIVHRRRYSPHRSGFGLESGLPRAVGRLTQAGPGLSGPLPFSRGLALAARGRAGQHGRWPSTTSGLAGWRAQRQVHCPG